MSTSLVTFSFGWNPTRATERADLNRRLPTATLSNRKNRVAEETWEIRVPSDSATAAVQAVGRLLGPAQEEELAYISAMQDLQTKAQSSEPWNP